MSKKQVLANYLEEDINNITEENEHGFTVFKIKRMYSTDVIHVFTEAEANAYAVEMVKAYTGETEPSKIAWRINADGREYYTCIDHKERKYKGYVICRDLG